MIHVYDVQTFYGTHQKTFQKDWHAQEYAKRLATEIDPDLIELHKRSISVEEFNMTDLAD